MAFDQKAFNECDPQAKSKIIDILKVYNKFSIREPVDKHIMDLYVYRKDEHYCNLEVEVKKFWSAGATIGDPLPTSFGQYLQLLPRKSKFWIKSQDPKFHACMNGKPTHFVMFNSDLSNYLTIHSSEMMRIYMDYEDGIISDTSYGSDSRSNSRGECFIQVPINKYNIKMGTLNKKISEPDLL